MKSTCTPSVTSPASSHSKKARLGAATGGDTAAIAAATSASTAAADGGAGAGAGAAATSGAGAAAAGAAAADTAAMAAATSAFSSASSSSSSASSAGSLAAASLGSGSAGGLTFFGLPTGRFAGFASSPPEDSAGRFARGVSSFAFFCDGGVSFFGRGVSGAFSFSFAFFFGGGGSSSSAASSSTRSCGVFITSRRPRHSRPDHWISHCPLPSARRTTPSQRAVRHFAPYVWYDHRSSFGSFGLSKRHASHETFAPSASLRPCGMARELRAGETEAQQTMSAETSRTSVRTRAAASCAT